MNEEDINTRLTPEEYHVLIEKGTEPPFSGKYLNETRDGTYVCKVCGNPLFSSNTKFDSGTGWPSFSDTLPGATLRVEDTRGGMLREEVLCSQCKSHLGHVFRDGPTETNKRYCINSVSLDLEIEK